jgi:predicted membrane chloride channel (bestrophin family)
MPTIDNLVVMAVNSKLLATELPMDSQCRLFTLVFSLFVSFRQNTTFERGRFDSFEEDLAGLT